MILKSKQFFSVKVVLGSYRSNFLSRKSLTASQKEAKEEARPIPSPLARMTRGDFGAAYTPPPPFTTAQHGL